MLRDMRRVLSQALLIVTLLGCLPDPEPLAVDEWATSTCQVLNRTLGQLRSDEPDHQLSQSLAEAVDELLAIEPPSEVGRLHDMLGDELEGLSGKARDLSGSGASWRRYRDESLARVRAVVDDLPSDTRALFNAACDPF